jgi:hypothetical protein
MALLWLRIKHKWQLLVNAVMNIRLPKMGEIS